MANLRKMRAAAKGDAILREGLALTIDGVATYDANGSRLDIHAGLSRASRGIDFRERLRAA